MMKWKPCTRCDIAIHIVRDFETTCITNYRQSTIGVATTEKRKKVHTLDLGLEPRTSKLEVLRAIQLRQPSICSLNGSIKTVPSF